MKSVLKQFREIINSIINWFYFPFLRFIPIETFRYAATGGGNLVLDTILYFLFYNFVFHKQVFDLGFIALEPHIAAFVVVFPITFLSGFLLAKYITFTQSNLRGRIQLIRYMHTVAGAIVLNYILLKLFVEVFGLYATLSKILTTLIVVLYSYVVQKHFTFKRKIIE